MVLGYKNTRQFAGTYLALSAFMVISFVVRLTKFEEFGVDTHIALTFIAFAIVATCWETLRLINRWLDEILPFERSVGGRIAVQLLLGSCLGLGIRLLIYYFGEPRIPFKLDALFIATTWFMYAILPAIINLGFFTAHFITRWKDSLLLAARLEKEKAQVQFDNLKNQLNPHFLFNALTSLNSLINEDKALASAFLLQLSRVYRYALGNKERTVVALHTELEFISHYVSLLRTRFADALVIDIRVPGDAAERGIVPVTLQILLENAIKHNVVDLQRPLVIRITVEEDYLVIRNNMQPKKRVDGSNNQGLANLGSLYSFLSREPVIVERDPASFTVKIPLL